MAAEVSSARPGASRHTSRLTTTLLRPKMWSAWDGRPRMSGIGGREAMAMKRLLAGVVCAAALVVVPASAAFAGEVKGPPGVPDNTNETGALEHANSACAASGLNALDSQEGQNESQVETAADSWKFYGLPKGSPGTLGLCRGGTGQRGGSPAAPPPPAGP